MVDNLALGGRAFARPIATPDPKQPIQKIVFNLANQTAEVYQNNQLINTHLVTVGRQDKDIIWPVTSVPGGTAIVNGKSVEVTDRAFPRKFDAIRFADGNKSKTPNNYFGTGGAAVDMVVTGVSYGGEPEGSAQHPILPSRLPGTLASFNCINDPFMKDMTPKEYLKGGVGFNPDFPKIQVRNQYGISGTQNEVIYEEELHNVVKTGEAKDEAIDAIITPHLRDEVTLMGNMGEAPLKVKTPTPGLARTTAKILREHPELKPEDIIPVNSSADIPKTVTKKTVFILKQTLADKLKESREKNPQFYNKSANSNRTIAAQTALDIYNNYTDKGSNAAPKSLLETLKPTFVNGRIAIIKNP